MWKEAVVAYCKVLRRMRGTSKRLRVAGRDSNQKPPEYKAGVLITTLQRSVGGRTELNCDALVSGAC
jgi:hypothetical protein